MKLKADRILARHKKLEARLRKRDQFDRKMEINAELQQTKALLQVLWG
jgi:hypothetical protein